MKGVMSVARQSNDIVGGQFARVLGNDLQIEESKEPIHDREHQEEQAVRKNIGKECSVLSRRNGGTDGVG